MRTSEIFAVRWRSQTDDHLARTNTPATGTGEFEQVPTICERERRRKLLLARTLEALVNKCTVQMKELIFFSKLFYAY